MSAWLWLAALFAGFAAIPLAVLASPIELSLRARFPRKPTVQADVRWLFGLIDVTVPAEVEPEPEPTPEPGRPGTTAEPEAERDDETTFEPRERPTASEALEREPEPGEPSPPPEPSTEPSEETTEAEPSDVGRTERALDQTVDYMETRRDIEGQVRAGLALIRTDGFLLEITRFLRDLVHAVNVHRIGLKAGFGMGSPAETGRVYGQLTAALAWTHATQKVHVDLDPDFQAESLEAEADAHVEARTWDLIRPFIVLLLAETTWEAISNARGELDG